MIRGLLTQIRDAGFGVDDDELIETRCGSLMSFEKQVQCHASSVSQIHLRNIAYAGRGNMGNHLVSKTCSQNHGYTLGCFEVLDLRNRFRVGAEDRGNSWELRYSWEK